MPDELPRIYQGEFLGWALHQQGDVFIATRPADLKGIGASIRANSLEKLKAIIAGDDLIESATI